MHAIHDFTELFLWFIAKVGSLFLVRVFLCTLWMNSQIVDVCVGGKSSHKMKTVKWKFYFLWSLEASHGIMADVLTETNHSPNDETNNSPNDETCELQSNYYW